MRKPVTLTMSHDLGQDAAIRRIKSGIDKAKSSSLPISIDAAQWNGNVLTFRVGALGLKCHGTITVLDDLARMEVHVPAVLSGVVGKCLAVVRSKGRILLGSN